MVAILFLGGVQLTTMSIPGEYLGRVFNEPKGQPLYHIKGFTPARTPAEAFDGRPDTVQAGEPETASQRP